MQRGASGARWLQDDCKMAQAVMLAAWLRRAPGGWPTRWAPRARCTGPIPTARARRHAPHAARRRPCQWGSHQTMVRLNQGKTSTSQPTKCLPSVPARTRVRQGVPTARQTCVHTVPKISPSASAPPSPGHPPSVPVANPWATGQTGVHHVPGGRQTCVHPEKNVPDRHVDLLICRHSPSSPTPSLMHEKT